MAKVVVVGAGVGGLAAAARLVATGHRVTVCEQSGQVGGKLGLHQARGYRFDTGPSLLTMPHLLRELFAATGDELDVVLDLLPVEPIARTRFPDGTVLDTLGDLDAFCAELDAVLGEGSGAQWRRFAARAAAIHRAVEGPFLSRPLEGVRGLLRQSGRIADLRTIAPWQTLRGLGAQYLHDPRLRMFLDRYATYTGSDPRRAPAALASIPHVEQTHGAWYVTGGLRRIADALVARLVEGGARVFTGADVTAIDLAAGRVRGVRLGGGERLPADVVVANADAAHLYGNLVDSPLAAGPRRALARSQPSLSGFVVLLGLTGTTPGLAHHSVFFPRDYDAEFDALFGRHPRPVEDPTLYLSVPRDPAVAPPGDEAAFLLVNAPRQGQGGVDWTRPGVACAYADHLLARLAARGLDVRGRVRHRHVISPADLARRTRAVGGAIYGSSSNGPASAFLRPTNRSPVPGLFLVGGSAHPGGGLPLVVSSARITAELIGPA